MIRSNCRFAFSKTNTIKIIVFLLLLEIPNFTAFVDNLQANTLNTKDASASEDKKQSLAIKSGGNIEIESLPSEKENKKSDEWSEIELENVDDNKKNTYYQVNNENSNGENEDDDVETVTYDLTDDIAINQMLADQGAPYNPDAEIFDINQFDLGKSAPKTNSNENKQTPDQESFDYQPYHHQNFDKQTSTIK